MDMPPIPSSLVERRQYDPRQSHQIASGIWWVGYLDDHCGTSHNPFLLMDGNEAILINPGSRVDKHFRTVRNKVKSLIDPSLVQHIVILHHDPDRCGSLPAFEKLAYRHVRIYAPTAAVPRITHYGCKNQVIGLEDGDSIIMKSGRSLDFYATPNLPQAGMGILHDSGTSTVFSGNILGEFSGEWNLFAPTCGWRAINRPGDDTISSRKAHLQALNKMERLAAERICMQCGPIIEDDVDQYIAAARELDGGR